ncbi:MAG: hypothetical protein AMJ53_08720 [Gammaproteobacteria bacterium SG8_11]|nr:MAG: hypothetical protein AMJ53_08720 [Gammaproteobacteria bacterium SG8_11]
MSKVNRLSNAARTGIVPLVLLLGLMPGQALALDLEFYTWGGFEIMEDAFRRLGLIFSDNLFARTVAAIAILGLVFGVTAFYLRGLAGAPVDFRAFAIPTLVGVVLFNALVLPTGTITVYDPTKNKVSAAPIPVPDAIVMLAGGLNLAQRVVREVVDTGSAYPYDEEAGGISFELVYRATAEYTDVDDFYLTKSVGQYFSDCAPPALASNSYGPNYQDLKRNTTDLRTELSLMQSTTTFTTMYTAAQKAGVLVSCTDAWTIWLNPIISDPLTYDTALSGVCGKAGFNPTDAQQMTACRDLMGRALDNYGVVGGDAIQFIRNIYLAQAIDRVMQKDNPDLAQLSVANRNLMVSGIGIGQTANEWLPIIYAVIYALALGMVPLLVLFLVTPLSKQAVLFTVGLFGWLTLWSISDMVTHKMAVDGAMSFFLQAQQYNWGLDAIWLSPEASAKALGLFGKIRSMGVMVATVLAFGIYRFGGYAFSNMAENFSGSIQSAGSDAAMRANTPEGRAQLMREQEDAAAKHAQRASQGFEDTVNAASLGMMKATAAGAREHRALQQHGGGGAGNLMKNIGDLGAFHAGQSVGQLGGAQGAASLMNGTSHPTEQQMQSVGKMMSEINTALGLQDAKARDHMLAKLGNGDKYQGAAWAASTKVVNEMTGTQTQNELAEKMQREYQQLTGQSMSKIDAFQAVHQMREASLFGNIDAFNGNPDAARDYYQTLANYNNQELMEMRRIGAQNDVSMTDMAQASGALRAYAKTGESKGLEGMPASTLIAASQYNLQQSTLDSAEKMNLTRYLAGLNDDSTLQTMDEVGRERAAHDMGRFITMAAIADQTGLDVRTLASKDAGASINIPISNATEFGKIAPMLRQNGILNAAQERIIAHEGYSGAFNLSMDPINGSPLAMDYRSGSGVSVYNTASTEESVRHSRDHAFDGATAVQMLNGDAPQYMWNDLIRTAAEDRRDGYWDTPEMRAFLEGTQKMYAPFGNVQDSHMESGEWHGSANLGINASSGQRGGGSGKGGRIPISGGGGWTGRQNDSETHVYNSIPGIYGNVIEKTLQFTEQDMIAEGKTPGTQDFQNELVRRATPMIQDWNEMVRGNFHANADEALQSGNDLASTAFEHWDRIQQHNLSDSQATRWRETMGGSGGSAIPSVGSQEPADQLKKNTLTGDSTTVISPQFATDEFRHYSANTNAQSMRQLFGTDIPDQAIERMRTAVATGEFAEPTIRVDDNRLQGHMAAYDSTTQEILISSQLAREAQDSPEGAMKMQAVISEEYGHHVDHQLRNVYSDIGGDAPRDEGALYARELLQDNPKAQPLIDSYFNDAAVQRDGKFGSLEFAEAKDHEQMQQRAYKNLMGDKLSEKQEERMEQLYYGNLARDLSQLRDADGQKKLTGMLNNLLESNPELRQHLAQSEYGKATMEREWYLDKFRFTPNMVDDLTHHGINALFESKFGRGISKEQLQQYKAAHHSDSPTNTFDSNNGSAYDSKTGMASYLTQNQSDDGYVQSELTKLHAALKRGDQVAADEHFGNIAHNTQDMFFHTNNIRLDLINQGHEQVIPFAPEVKTEYGQRYAGVSGAFTELDMGYSMAPIAANTAFSTNQEAQHIDEADQEAVKRGLKALFPDVPPEQFDKAFAEAAPVVSTYMGAKQWVNENAPWLSAPLDWVSTPINEAGNWGIRTAAEFIPLVQNAHFDVGKDNPTHSQLTFDHKDGTGHELAYILAQEHTQELMDQYLKLEAWYKTPEHLRTGEAPNLNAVINKAYSHPNDYSHIAHSPAAQQWIKQHPDDIERMGYYSAYGQFVADMTKDPVRGLAAEQALFANIRENGRTAQQYIDDPTLFLQDAGKAFKQSGDYYDSAKQQLQEKFNQEEKDPLTIIIR